ncbi:MAG: hypothetical protein QOI01_1777 [Mycobacterium sp.]|jgi:uncharacterized membrane protein|nr:hypothetical protein [Mycobacterium sp.]
MTNPPPPPSEGGYPPPPDDGYPPPPQGGYPPPPPQGGYPPPPQGGYPAPPPQGGYPPPPPGGYPPPPQGGYGAPPPQGGYPPPPQTGYGGPQGGYTPQGGYGPPPGSYGAGQQVDIGEAFSWAWNKFSKNAVPLIVATLVYGLIVAALSVVVFVLANALSPDSIGSYSSDDTGFSYSASSGFGLGSYVAIFLGSVLTFVVVGAFSSAYYAGLLDIANGQPVTIGSFFKPRNVGSVVVASLLIGLVSSILSFCFIFSLVISLFTLFTTVSIVDRNLPPVDAIKASFAVVKANFVQVLLAWLIIGVIVTVGALLCGIGVIVAVPVATLFLVHTYRKLSSGQIAPLTP